MANTRPSLKLTHEGALRAIGVGSGTGAQDCEVARAGLAALGAQAL